MLVDAADREEPRCPGGPASSAGQRGRPSPARASDAELLAAIGRDLQAVYADVLRQPLPERFAALLEHIEANTRARRT